MNEYLVTIWDKEWQNRKYCYRIATTDVEEYKKQLKKQYDRFTIDYIGEFK